MRPLRLELEGFSTFREPTVVDFDDVDLAAFVGPTGSGKSSIIDAITFALYGAVARYDDKGTVAPVISSLAAEAKVRLDFLLGNERYTAVRVVRRARSGGATTKEARLERAGENAGVVLASQSREVDPAVSQLLGLDFAQFTKTVVLPQGDFAQFLHDKPSTRQELLRRLLDLGLYVGIGQTARARAAAASNRASVILEQLEKEGAVTDEQIQELTEREARLTAAREEVGRLLEDLRAAEVELATLAARRDEATANASLLAAVQVPAELAAVLAAAEAAAARVAAADDDLAAAFDQFNAADAAVTAGPDLAECTRLLGEYAAHAQATAEVTTASAALEEAATLRSAAAGAATDLRQQLGHLAAVVEQARSIRDTAEDAMARGPDAEQVRHVQARRRERAETQTVVARAGALVATAEAARTASAARLTAGRERAADAVAEQQQRQLASGAAGLVAALVAGEPCPVCRQIVASIPDHDLDAELARAEGERAAADAELASADDAHRSAELAHARAAAESDAAARRLAELDAALADAPDDTRIDALLAEAEGLRAALQAAGVAATDAERAESAAKTDPLLLQALAKEHEAGRAHDRAEAELAARSARLAELEASLVGAPPVNQLEAGRDLASELAAAQTAARSALAAAQLVQRSAKAEGERAALDRAELAQRYQRTRDGVAVLGPPQPGSSATLAADWAELTAWATAEAERLGALQRELDAAIVVLAGDRDTRRAAIGRCCAEVGVGIDATRALAGGGGGAGEGPAEALARAQGAATTALAQAVATRQAQAKRRAEAEAFRAEADVATLLAHLLRTDGFERWLLAEAVADLVDRATARLHELSGGQYSLVADGTEFKVRDHRNADEIRDAKTLSGGETFLASLALALALADSIAELAPSGAPRLESLFLDEGFGTLDADTLDVVAAALEELGASGRMVAIVTHIRDLAERMPVRFEVSKGATTSTVTRSDR